jgi:multisubunit Na+/H+ antiporter MnhG subunit
MPEKEHAVAQLKSELATLQEKIRHLEGKEASKEKKAVKTLFRWQSFSRPYTKRTAKWIVYTFLLVATIILILLFVHEFFIIAPVLALAFVAYILASVPPEIIENAVTTQGINTADRSYIWEELDDFWFTERRGFTILHVDTFTSWPGRLLLLINPTDKEKIRELLVRYIPYRELPKTSWLDHLADSLSAAFHKVTG